MIEIETDDEDEPPKKRRRIVRLPTGEILPPTTYDEIDSETEMIMPGHRKSISAKHVRRKILPFFIQQLINIVLIMPFLVAPDFDQWTKRHQIEFLSRERQKIQNPEKAKKTVKRGTARSTYSRQTRRKREVAVKIRNLEHELDGLKVKIYLFLF